MTNSTGKIALYTVHACPFAVIYAIKLKMLNKTTCTLKNRKPRCNMSWHLYVGKNHSHMRCWLGNHVFCLPIAVLILLQRLFQSCTLYVSLKVHFLCFNAISWANVSFPVNWVSVSLYFICTCTLQYIRRKNRKKDLNIATVIARQYNKSSSTSNTRPLRYMMRFGEPEQLTFHT